MIDTNHICNNRTLRTPDFSRYDAGAKVTVTATPARGYRFDGWGTPDSKDSVMTVTMNNDLSLTANFSVVPKPPKPVAEKPPKEKGKSSPLKLTMRWSGAALAVGGIVGGIAFDGMAATKYDEVESARTAKHHQRETSAVEETENLVNIRNTLYILGGVGLSAFTITLFF